MLQNAFDIQLLFCRILYLYVWVKAVDAGADLDMYGRTELSRNITLILNRLANHTTYDKRLRPNYGGDPVEVGITIHVSSISAVSEVEMDYTLDIYLRQMWKDERLAFNATVSSITIDVEYMKSIWVPDTFFPNEKKSLAHTATTHNSFLRITREGDVTTSQRLTVTAACSMNLELFPMDSQVCTLEIESYGYSMNDIIYVWRKANTANESVTTEGDFPLPQFKVLGHKISDSENVLQTGNYSRLNYQVSFVRSVGFYVTQIYLPSILIVVISWVSFWLSRDATPARVALGVTTVLTMTTLMTTTNAQLPKVSYVKSIDIYLGTCFLMVFASLLEYAAVGYLNKRLKMRKEIEAREQNQQTLPPSSIAADPDVKPNILDASLQKSSQNDSAISPTFSSSPAHTHYGSFSSPRVNDCRNNEMTPLTSAMRESNFCECETRRRTGSSRQTLSKYGTTEMETSRPKKPIIVKSRVKIILPKPTPSKQHSSGDDRNMPRRRAWDSIRPSSIDKYSRVLFPILFAAFNLIYWLVYFSISKKSL